MINAWLFFGSLNVCPPTYLYYVKIDIFLSAYLINLPPFAPPYLIYMDMKDPI